VVYSDGENKRLYSLRSQKLYGAKVNVIAELFGGGGHPNAAGFSISYDDPRFGKSHKELDLTRKDKLKIWLKSFL
jgi:nanoRNase/pAp phosphatase (c-di-AMP/oligoRNAs hydrolase)